MTRNNQSVPLAVESIITHNQAIHTCMKQRIINFHALAGLIRTEVEKSVGRPASINTLVVAIKRFSDALKQERSKSFPPVAVLKDAKITLTSDIADVTIRPKKSEFQEILKKIVEISAQLDESPDLFKSSNLIKLVADEKEYRSSIRGELKKTHIEREVTGVSKLVLRLSPLTKRDPGFTLFISELLYNQGVNVIHSYIDEDTILIVKTEDAAVAYEILEREIVRSKSLLKSNSSVKRRAAGS
ncbi:MAG: hypothetical protein ACREBS_03260 [Nitrososphaerales archaeon]